MEKCSPIGGKQPQLSWGKTIYKSWVNPPSCHIFLFVGGCCTRWSPFFHPKFKKKTVRPAWMRAWEMWSSLFWGMSSCFSSLSAAHIAGLSGTGNDSCFNETGHHLRSVLTVPTDDDLQWLICCWNHLVPDLLRCRQVPKVARNFSPLRCICSGLFDDRQMGGLFLCGHAFFEWDNPYRCVAFIPKLPGFLHRYDSIYLHCIVAMPKTRPYLCQLLQDLYSHTLKSLWRLEIKKKNKTNLLPPFPSLAMSRCEQCGDSIFLLLDCSTRLLPWRIFLGCFEWILLVAWIKNTAKRTTGWCFQIKYSFYS